MKKITNLVSSGFQKVRKFALSVSTAFALGLASALPASAATSINSKATTSSVMGGILDIIFNIAFYIGVVIAVIGVVSFIMAFKDDNAESQSRGVRLAIVGIVLIGIRGLIEMTGLIS